MKNFIRIFSLALLQAGLLVLLPFLLPLSSAAEQREEAPPIPSAEETLPEQAEEPPTKGEAVFHVLPAGEGESVDMTETDYLFGVVAAEMPARFEPEALRAQAVAARTYAFYRMGQNKHGGAVCTDPACCQAWMGEEALRERWGVDYEKNAAKVRSAVESTRGQILTWEGEPILAAFHACSGGMTETGQNVFGLDLGYLASVPSMEDGETVPDYRTEVSLDPAELYAAVSRWDAEAALAASEGPLLTDPVYSPAGRLLRVKLCGKEVTGLELRRLFSLRSTELSWQRTEDGGIRFFVTGYGHGAGMSQYGAQAMAAAGEGYAAILAHFYPGAELEDSF